MVCRNELMSSSETAGRRSSKTSLQRDYRQTDIDRYIQTDTETDRQR